MKQQPSGRHRFFIACTLLVLCGVLPRITAQQQMVLQNFKFGPSGYYPPPHQKQLRSLLTGARAERRPAGLYFITQGRFETYFESGQPEMLVQAPSCVYEDGGDHSIHSPSGIDIRAADGKFSIAGEGFRWQTNSSFFISNRVHTIVHPELLQSQKDVAATNNNSLTNKGVDIISDRFDYAGESGIGNYRTNVHVAGADLDMTATRLQFLVPMKEKVLQRMTADENVTLMSGEVRATGQHVDYATDSGLIKIQGQPQWQAAQKQGQADELTIDRSNRIFQAVGNARLQIITSNAAASTFLPGISSGATNEVVEISSERYEIRTNSAEFSSGVVVIDKLGEQPRGKITCRHLSAYFGASNQLQQLVADHDVIIEQSSKRFTATNANFNGTNQLLTLNGDPTWQDGERSGRAELLVLDGARNELTARGKASLRLPAGTFGETGPGGAARQTGTTNAAWSTNSFAEIFSPEYSLKTNAAAFHGGVRVSHPEMQLACKTLSFDVPDSAERAQTIVAQDEVAFDLIRNGEKIHGTGQKAIYTYQVASNTTNDFVELTGKPKLTMANGSSFENKVIVFDRANGKVVAPGRYFIRSLGDSTNEVQLPKLPSKRKR